MNEFGLIAEYFRPLASGRAEAGDMSDDAAVLNIPEDCELVVTSDTLNAGTHFFEDENPEYIARKALRVNLSDLAAMGAAPLAYQLNIAFPEKPGATWLKKFTEALLQDQEQFGIFCSGGDTTSIQGPLSISITAFGIVPKGKALRRGGAKPGDLVMLSGPVGDAWIGLQCLKDEIKTAYKDYFIEAYRKPHPELDTAQRAREYIRAAIDISDGLIADLRHICDASACAARIELGDGIFSPPAEQLIADKIIAPQNLLTGGDDYRLLMAVSEENSAILNSLGAKTIGVFQDGSCEVKVYDKNGAILPVAGTGWTHF